jgi:hypothetical protein
VQQGSRAVDDFIAAVERATGRPGRKVGRETELLCPVHGDTHPSLNVREGDNEQPIVQCRSQGCSYEQVCDAIGWRPSPNGSRTASCIVGVYVYRDEQGEPLFECVRLAPKDFRLRRFDPFHPDADAEGYVWKLGDRRVVYRLPELRAEAERGGVAFFVEGERQADELASIGLVATTSPMGAGKWRDEYAEHFRGLSRVVILPDDDNRGRDHGDAAGRSLQRVVDDVRVVELWPRGETKNDVSDWLDNAENEQERAQARHLLEQMADAAPPAAEWIATLDSQAETEPPPAEAVVWLESAADLLRERDPGPTPFLVRDLIVDLAIAALVGMWKVAKTWVLIELAVAIVTGRKAFGEYEVPIPGPVILVMEESGRAAFHRRLDRLRRGYALKSEQLADLYFAANLGVRLNEAGWQNRLLDAAAQLRPRAVLLDPFARLKGATVDESSQREVGPILDFLRILRDQGATGVVYAHHTGHDGQHQRGSSDLEGYWESRLVVAKTSDGTRTITADHREAESAHSFRFLLDFDETTRSLRLKVQRGDLEELVEEYLRANPTASKNGVADNVGGRRSDILRLYDVVKDRLEPHLDGVE